MSDYKSWTEFMEAADKKLLSVELTFTSMDKGNMHYEGVFNGEKVHCIACECEVSDYSYSAKETVDSVTQAEYVYLTVGNKVILNTY